MVARVLDWKDLRARRRQRAEVGTRRGESASATSAPNGVQSDGPQANVVQLASARLRHGPAEKRLPLPDDLLAIAEVAVEIGAKPGGPLWRAVERRMQAHVESCVPAGARDWRVHWDPERFEIVLRWRA